MLRYILVNLTFKVMESFPFLLGQGGLYTAPTKEDRSKWKARRRERDQIEFLIDRWYTLSPTKEAARYMHNSYHNTSSVTDNWRSLQHRRRYFFSELFLGKALVAYKKPQQRKKEENERLRGERDQIKLIDLRFEKGLESGFQKGSHWHWQTDR